MGLPDLCWLLYQGVLAGHATALLSRSSSRDVGSRVSFCNIEVFTDATWHIKANLPRSAPFNLESGTP